MDEHTLLTDVTCDALFPSENARFHPLELDECVNGITSVLPSFQAALFLTSCQRLSAFRIALFPNLSQFLEDTLRIFSRAVEGKKQTSSAFSIRDS
jgi:hypothetical protein